MIDLSKAVSIHITSPDLFGEGPYFQIDMIGRVYYLLAESQDKRTEWVQILRASKKYYAEKCRKS